MASNNHEERVEENEESEREEDSFRSSGGSRSLDTIGEALMQLAEEIRNRQNQEGGGGGRQYLEERLHGRNVPHHWDRWRGSASPLSSYIPLSPSPETKNRRTEVRRGQVSQVSRSLLDRRTCQEERRGVNQIAEEEYEANVRNVR